MVAPRESAGLGHDIVPGTLTLHADRGASMRSKPVAALLVDLDHQQAGTMLGIRQSTRRRLSQEPNRFRARSHAPFHCLERSRSTGQRIKSRSSNSR